MGSSSRLLLNQSTHSNVAYSTASKDRHGPPPMDDFGLVEAVDGLSQGVVIAVAHTADRRLDAGLGRRSVYLIDRYWLPRSL